MSQGKAAAHNQGVGRTRGRDQVDALRCAFHVFVKGVRRRAVNPPERSSESVVGRGEKDDTVGGRERTRLKWRRKYAARRSRVRDEGAAKLSATTRQPRMVVPIRRGRRRRRPSPTKSARQQRDTPRSGYQQIYDSR